MSGSTDHAPDEDRVACPTCGARQDWSDVCRRCRSDLALLRRVTLGYHELRRQCLRAIRSGRYDHAIRLAEACVSLSPDPDSTRLLAVCRLLCRDWRRAVGGCAAFATPPDRA